MSPVKISVLMAVYNTSFKLVKRAINSVLNQNYKNFELLIIDDGSDIFLSKKLLTYTEIHQQKITYLRHKNCGQSASINKGIKISKGNYITIVDADDEYKVNHLQTCVTRIKGVDLISSKAEIIVNKKSDYFVPDKSDNSKNIHVDDCILFATLFGKREVFETIPFKSMYAADSDFYEQASKKYRVKKINTRTYIYYRNSKNSVTARLKKKLM